LDPTRKDAGVPNAADFKRSVGAIFIAYDPNNGQLSVKVEGLNPVEELGVLQWAIAMRLGEHSRAQAEANQKGKIIQ
jgi:hypothetical protein